MTRFAVDPLLKRYGRPVPRYTSYPTAPHFSPAVTADDYAGWLAAVPGEAPVSVYVHVPFCAELCLYCGCNTQVVRNPGPVRAYAQRLASEIAMVAAALPKRMRVTHLHFGGGTPSMLSAEDFDTVMGALRDAFAFAADAEIAIEIDPRVMEADKAQVLARHGFNRASLGVQDFADPVQEAIGRLQSFEQTGKVARELRAAGIASINVDLMYGLPRQSEASVAQTAEAALALEPDRIAVFGYAHVPWMKKHQALIREQELPGPKARFAQARRVEDILVGVGYRAVGLDHFARPQDDMARRAADGTLKRNFQGYTTDDAPVLIGLGVSAIGALPQGYVQNVTSTPLWHKEIEAGRLPVARGLALSAEDRLRRDVIERLMCDLEVDLGAVCARHGVAPDTFSAELARLAPLEEDGLCARDGLLVRIPAEARTFARVVCAVFDTYLAPPDQAAQTKRHAAAV